MTDHTFELETLWTGNSGEGTSKYDAYSRDYEVRANGKPVLLSSADKAFRGDRARYNPEELLIAALSGCHLLSYLHVCADAGVVVTRYEDRASGVMAVDRAGRGAFTDVLLRPVVTVATGSMVERGLGLHEAAHRMCFIANSVSFPVRNEPTVTSDQV